MYYQFYAILYMNMSIFGFKDFFFEICTDTTEPLTEQNQHKLFINNLLWCSDLSCVKCTYKNCSVYKQIIIWKWYLPTIIKYYECNVSNQTQTLIGGTISFNYNQRFSLRCTHDLNSFFVSSFWYAFPCQQ